MILFYLGGRNHTDTAEIGVKIGIFTPSKGKKLHLITNPLKLCRLLYGFCDNSLIPSRKAKHDKSHIKFSEIRY